MTMFSYNKTKNETIRKWIPSFECELQILNEKRKKRKFFEYPINAVYGFLIMLRVWGSFISIPEKCQSVTVSQFFIDSSIKDPSYCFCFQNNFISSELQNLIFFLLFEKKVGRCFTLDQQKERPLRYFVVHNS